MTINLSDWNAETLQKKQTELTRLSNGVKKQASGAIFSKKQQQTLIEAANILSGFKQQVEHAKEKKAREEREHQQKVELSTKQARRILNSQLEALTTSQKVELAVRNNQTCGWPYSYYSEVLETLNMHGLKRFEDYLKHTLLDWAGHIAPSMGRQAHSSWMPEPVTPDNAKRYIDKAINGDSARSDSTNLKQILTKIEELIAIQTADNVVLLK